MNEIYDEIGTPRPSEGGEIYVNSDDEFYGGKATIASVKPQVSAGKLVWFISVVGNDGHWYNYASLLSDQKHLKETYCDQIAYKDLE